MFDICHLPNCNVIANANISALLQIIYLWGLGHFDTLQNVLYKSNWMIKWIHNIGCVSKDIQCLVALLLFEQYKRTVYKSNRINPQKCCSIIIYNKAKKFMKIQVFFNIFLSFPFIFGNLLYRDPAIGKCKVLPLGK